MVRPSCIAQEPAHSNVNVCTLLLPHMIFLLTFWMQFKFRKGEAELAQKLRAARAKRKVLQQVLHDVQSQQKLWSSVVQDQKKMTAQFRQKTQQYTSDVARFQKHLDKDNFDETVSGAHQVVELSCLFITQDVHTHVVIIDDLHNVVSADHIWISCQLLRD